MSKVSLYRGNCLNILRKMDDNIADCVITSPPYNMNLRIRNGKYCSRQLTTELTTKYVDFADNLPMEEYYSFHLDVIKELLRVSDLVFYNVQIVTGNKPAIFKILGELSSKVKELIIWDKEHGQPAIRDNVMNSQFELIIVFQNSEPEQRRFKSATFKRGTLTNLWRIPRGRKISKDHGAVFPEELVSRIIDNFTEEGSTILDPFMGTGTSGVVSRKMNRNFIGIELSRFYMDIARNRIRETKRNRR